MIRTVKKQGLCALVESFQSGNQTQKNFCSEHGISYSTFQFWLRRYRQEYSVCSRREQKLASGGFVRLKTTSDEHRKKSNDFDVVIEYPGGIRISFGSVPETGLIRDLLAVQVR